MRSEDTIAVVGMACRFPGAPDLLAYWRLLRSAVDAVQPAPAWRKGPEAGYLDAIYDFDARAFRAVPEEARHMDPQQRLLLEVTWEAFEDAGLDPDSLSGSRTGVFVGLTWDDHLRLHEAKEDRPSPYTAAGNIKTFAANRLSHFFDLRGPSFAMDSACASSLVALHQACASIRNGDCDSAVVASAELILSDYATTMMGEAGVLSKQAQCRALDDRADGFVRGEGGAALYLKRTADLLSHERAHCLLLGSAVNHNGNSAWLMRSSAEGIERAIRDAWARANVGPDDVDYVELHGTATRQGDDAEVQALRSVFSERRTAPCSVGSVKTNLGNLGAASGLASVIKVVLCAKHGLVVPTLHLERPCAALREAPHIAPPLANTSWPAQDGVRRAGVTAASFGGCNVHLVLQMPEDRGTPFPHVAETQLLALSARSEAGLRSLVEAYRAALAEGGGLDDTAWSWLCHSASYRRRHWQKRLAIVADSKAEARTLLSGWLQAGGLPGEVLGSVQREDEVLHIQAAEFVESGRLPAADVSYPPVTTLPPVQWSRKTYRSLSLAVPAERDSDTCGELESKLATLHTFCHRHDVVTAWLEDVVRGLSDAHHVDSTRGFFDLGLNSVACLDILSQLSKALRVDLDRTVLFEATTVESLAAHALRTWQEANETGPDLPPGSAPPTHAHQRLSELLDAVEAEYAIDGAREVHP